MAQNNKERRQARAELRLFFEKRLTLAVLALSAAAFFTHGGLYLYTDFWGTTPAHLVAWPLAVHLLARLYVRFVLLRQTARFKKELGL